MSLSEVPSERQITDWFHALARQIQRYGRTLWLVLRSPSSLVGRSMRSQSISRLRAQIAPLPFVVLTVVFASVLETVVASLWMCVSLSSFLGQWDRPSGDGNILSHFAGGGLLGQGDLWTIPSLLASIRSIRVFAPDPSNRRHILLRHG